MPLAWWVEGRPCGETVALARMWVGGAQVTALAILVESHACVYVVVHFAESGVVVMDVQGRGECVQ
eukprot:7779862-Alexandrium_andersonii.AAC.1